MKKNIFNVVVPINSEGNRIDKFLQSQFKELSRTRIQQLILDGNIKLNNKERLSFTNRQTTCRQQVRGKESMQYTLYQKD